MSGVDDGTRLYNASRGRREPVPVEDRVQSGVGRGEVLARAQRGDREARQALRGQQLGRPRGDADPQDDAGPDASEAPAADYGGGTRDGAGSPARSRYSPSSSTTDGAELFKQRGAGYDA